MNPFLLSLKVRTRPLGLHRICGRDARVLLAVLIFVGLPLSVAGESLLHWLYDLSPVLIGRYSLSDDVFALGVVAAFSLLLGVFMFIGRRLLRRFLS